MPLLRILLTFQDMNLRFSFATAALCLALAAESVAAQPPASRVLFRVFLSDGRVLSSYGEWSRLEDRVIFSMPTQLTRDPVELQLVSIPSQRVDWPRTELYAESVRAAAYAATRGDADYTAFSTDMARALSDIAKISDPGVRLATAERARERLAEWPATHYGYRIDDVREAIGMLDEIIAQLRLAVGITRFDLSLSTNAALVGPPPPPLPPPSDGELIEQFVAAASMAQSPAERMGLLQTVLHLLDRAIGLLPVEWAERMRHTVTGDLEHEARIERSYDDLRTRTLEAAGRLAAKGQTWDFERLREKVKDEDRRLGGQRPADMAALLATIDMQAATAAATRDAQKEWEKRLPSYRKYRRTTNASFKVFRDAAVALEQIKAMTGPSVDTMAALTRRLAGATKNFAKATPPSDLAQSHAVIASAWELADHAFALRREALSSNSADLAQRASSAAAGALLLYQNARNQQLNAMEPPAGK